MMLTWHCYSNGAHHECSGKSTVIGYCQCNCHYHNEEFGKAHVLLVTDSGDKDVLPKVLGDPDKVELTAIDMDVVNNADFYPEDELETWKEYMKSVADNIPQAAEIYHQLVGAIHEKINHGEEFPDEGL